MKFFYNDVSFFHPCQMNFFIFSCRIRASSIDGDKENFLRIICVCFSLGMARTWTTMGHFLTDSREIVRPLLAKREDSSKRRLIVSRLLCTSFLARDYLEHRLPLLWYPKLDPKKRFVVQPTGKLRANPKTKHRSSSACVLRFDVWQKSRIRRRKHLVSGFLNVFAEFWYY